jgi:hypothetical protein
MSKKEADITINGYNLTSGQSMAVRVAISSMLMDLSEPEYMKEMGEIGLNYQERLSEVQSIIVQGVKQ